MHYLLSYDERTVTDVLKSTDIADGSSQRALKYLEKIVQYPFSIPPIQPAHRDREVDETLNAVARRCGINLESSNVVGPQTAVVSRFLDLVSGEDLTTLRSIRRLCAQFEVAMMSVGVDEVDYLDLLLVTHLRVAYPNVHRLVARFRNLLVSSRTLGTGLLPNDALDWASMLATALPETDSWIRIEILDLLHYLFERIPRGSRGPANLGFSRYASGRISDPDYFDRYVFLTLPQGDIGDAQIMHGLAELAQTGELSTRSDLCAALRDERARLASDKCARYLEEAHQRSPFTAHTAESAAHLLCTRLIADPSHTAIDAAAARFVGGLLMRSMCLCASEQDGQVVLDRFEAAQGLVRTTLLLDSVNVYPHERHESDSGPSKTWFTNHRQHQLDACILDITSDDGVESGILTFWRFMDQRQRDRLSACVLEEIANGRDLLDVAKCFVGTRLAQDGSRTAGSIYANELEALVPRNHWQVAQTDGYSISDADSLALQQRKIAQAWLSQELYRPGSEQP